MGVEPSCGFVELFTAGGLIRAVELGEAAQNGGELPEAHLVDLPGRVTAAGETGVQPAPAEAELAVRKGAQPPGGSPDAGAPAASSSGAPTQLASTI